ncbi:Poly [ADP-ribose] polymerase [Heracleum sosnowskyi]|uniref:Poly [ADP-ribose] polymerase n=1 Tax=Heracleum sosnowskyi TaxID=360622 RepID=A0AAD8GUD6_9APIA|nr:Poly [ADP-ribose] polymerase [Heracleum sosnowskyi]
MSTRSNKRLREEGSERGVFDDGPEEVKGFEKYSRMSVKQLQQEATERWVSAIGLKKELVERLCAADVSDPIVSYGEEKKVVEESKYTSMGVKQLRQEATARELSAIGTKKELVDRLSVADSPEPILLDGEEKNFVDDNKYPSMTVKQLHEVVTARGISATGSKKELIDRLSVANKSENIEFDGDENKHIDDNKKEKLVTATKKGAAVLDQWLSDEIKLQYHVLQRGDEIYDAMLNQTNVGDNNNKFYVIQLLESDDRVRYMVYNRWGRVGIKGQDKLHGPFTSLECAIQEFEQKFYAKTKNQWSARKDFVCYPKCYRWLEMDYTETDKESDVQAKQTSVTDIQPRETKLEARVANFISLICNVSMMKQQMLEIGYNADKLPLGKLSRSTISEGYKVLKKIADVIGQSDRKKLEQLSGEFYTVIPHDFGFKKMPEFLLLSLLYEFLSHVLFSEFVIDSPQKLKRKLEMVEALGEIVVATKLLEDDMGMQEDPLYSSYERLNCKLLPLEVHSKEFSMVSKYMKNTHAKTHSNYTVDVVQILRVSREGEAERFKKFSGTKNRMLLWHGSRLTNWTGILKQGLRIAPPEAPVTGYMFGKGVYFADMFSKSANYCCSTRTATSGVLLLCEVALGDMAELLDAKYDADKLPDGKLSTKGVGATAPDLSEVETLEDGVVVPLGKPKQRSDVKASLLYNEYIVYDPDQIRMRYVVHVNFNFKR